MEASVNDTALALTLVVGGCGSNGDSGGVCQDSNGGAVRCGNKIDGTGGAGHNGSGGVDHGCRAVKSLVVVRR